MRYFRLLPVVALFCQVAWGDDGTPKRVDNPGAGGVAANNARVILPPVMRTAEPADNVVVTLPGPAPKPVIVAPPPPATIVHWQPLREDPERPILRRPKRNFPEGFERDCGEFLNQRLGSWNEAGARELLGEPTSTRPAYGDGQIYTYSDPTGRYRSLELDFDKETGRLRTVFVYPLRMTWQECRRTFGAKVRATQANKGRVFYSYVDRRLDVLVDQTGRVISLGMY